MTEYKYEGRYCPVFPIKVNQVRHVVDVITEAGRPFSMGLEVGSKPELVAVLAIQDTPDALLICNGYKDRRYIELAMLAKRVGRRPIIVIEKPSEIALVLEVAAELGVEPEIGFRLRLAGKGAGRWERSGGERAKFGLTVPEIVSALDYLRERDKLDCVRLLHFHIGSQLTAISSLKVGLREASQVYVQLQKRCPRLEFIDVGGGLAVDYDGSKTSSESSMNYTMEEYARDVVWIIQEACDQAEAPHPVIVTECGRATVAYHSVLVFDVLGNANTFSTPCDPQKVLAATEAPAIVNMAQLLQELTPKNCVETLHDAIELRQDILQQFNLGLLSIEDRALGDEAYWALLNAMSNMSHQFHYVPEDLQRLPAMLTDTYFCNLSIFQSMPDSWAVDQIFPITPISRLNEEPTRRVVLADITCDSDGKIDRFPDLRDVKRYLPAHNDARRRALHLRRLPRRRLPGDPGRPAQPVRRHQRRPRGGQRAGGIRQRRARRLGETGAQLRPVRQGRPRRALAHHARARRQPEQDHRPRIGRRAEDVRERFRRLHVLEIARCGGAAADARVASAVLDGPRGATCVLARAVRFRSGRSRRDR